ncbi:MAG: ISAzo13 family transposase, partial [Actinobacteria bacterium]|nr:ISAzo13 family transposase [Actinomycetota bacterium]
ARALGRGGPTRVAEASGMSRSTVITGTKEMAAGAGLSDRVRAPGAGRRFLIDEQPGVLQELDDLVEPEARGDPMSPLRWTAKSTENLARALVAKGYKISADTVGRLLKAMGYSLQAPAKALEGAQHPDRDGQFRYLNRLATERVQRCEPVVSIDCKKKELVGQKTNGGKEYQPTKSPERVDVHDFPDPEMGKAIPFGVYDVGTDEGWVSLGDDHDTAAFAVNAVRRWWQVMGLERYPKARRLLITADAGGSNSYRNRSFKVELGRLAAETGLEITVCHYPPGTSKWNKIEHRLFSFVTKNWRGRPLTSYRTIVELIGATKTKTGLRVLAEWDQGSYPTGMKVTDEELAAVPLSPHDWHGEWNYTIVAPKRPRRRR